MTVGDLKKWLEDNKVPDDLVFMMEASHEYDYNNREVVSAAYLVGSRAVVLYTHE